MATIVYIDQQKVDVTTLLKWHPGGRHSLESNHGNDVTDLFYAIHRGVKFSHLVVKEDDGVPGSKYEPPHVRDFRKLHAWMQRAGWYDPTPRHFVMHMTVEALLFIASLCFTMKGSVVVGALLMGMFWHHSAGIGHDLGHSSVFQQRWMNCLIGSGMSAFTGLSSLWWRHSHFQHHIHTNVLPQDPDILHLPIFAITEKLFAHTSHEFLGKAICLDRVTATMVAIQHLTLYPLLFVARFNLYVQSIVHLATSTMTAFNKYLFHIERLGFIFFVCWYVSLVYFMKSWKERIVFVLLSHVTSGILHVQIVISHWACETFGDQKDDHYLHTLKTTMDVQCASCIDWVHLGLQFQVAHHLYPRLPRYRLRQATAYVIDICKEHDLPYLSHSFVGANLLLYNTMYQVTQRIPLPHCE